MVRSTFALDLRSRTATVLLATLFGAHGCSGESDPLAVGTNAETAACIVCEDGYPAETSFGDPTPQLEGLGLRISEGGGGGGGGGGTDLPAENLFRDHFWENYGSQPWNPFTTFCSWAATRIISTETCTSIANECRMIADPIERIRCVIRRVDASIAGGDRNCRVFSVSGEKVFEKMGDTAALRRSGDHTWIWVRIGARCFLVDLRNNVIIEIEC